MRDELRKDALTEQQLKVLRAIRDHIKRTSISPTYVEIGAAVSRSKETVRNTLGRLIAKGMVKRAPGYFRNLVITEKGLAAAANGRRRKKAGRP